MEDVHIETDNHALLFYNMSLSAYPVLERVFVSELSPVHISLFNSNVVVLNCGLNTEKIVVDEDSRVEIRRDLNVYITDLQHQPVSRSFTLSHRGTTRTRMTDSYGYYKGFRLDESLTEYVITISGIAYYPHSLKTVLNPAGHIIFVSYEMSPNLYAGCEKNSEHPITYLIDEDSSTVWYENTAKFEDILFHQESPKPLNGIQITKPAGSVMLPSAISTYNNGQWSNEALAHNMHLNSGQTYCMSAQTTSTSTTFKLVDWTGFMGNNMVFKPLEWQHFVVENNLGVLADRIPSHKEVDTTWWSYTGYDRNHDGTIDHTDPTEWGWVDRDGKMVVLDREFAELLKDLLTEGCFPPNIGISLDPNTGFWSININGHTFSRGFWLPENWIRMGVIIRNWMVAFWDGNDDGVVDPYNPWDWLFTNLRTGAQARLDPKFEGEIRDWLQSINPTRIIEDVVIEYIGEANAIIIIVYFTDGSHISHTIFLDDYGRPNWFSVGKDENGYYVQGPTGRKYYAPPPDEQGIDFKNLEDLRDFLFENFEYIIENWESVDPPQGISGVKEDSDGDGLTNYEEDMKYKTDPLNPDTDGDGVNDGEELAYWRKIGPRAWLTDYDEDGKENNLLDPDSDNDDLKDGIEFRGWDVTINKETFKVWSDPTKKVTGSEDT
ncbi:MAG: hypothetical protein QCI38_06225, partial [Candidatus Thermoplasmatota archaeon]|nr:hypothetical protein [Candidatus Thermoplasmatota archaeon]